ncbi:MAG: type I restriction endonuclease subunit R, partial [Flavobacteriales bacterium]|nr:type I restriction endonuclease subunit R [Flavobacteriales bacterium]
MTQPEAILEDNLIKQLNGLGYERVVIKDEDAILVNLKSQLEKFNNTSFTEREFSSILNHLSKGNIFERAKTLRDRFALVRDNEDSFYVRFFNSEDVSQNLIQVTNQVTQEGSYKNRYDVTILINGLPLVQIELKRRGGELKEAFNQILRYKRHSYWANSGLFQFVQLFVISNGGDTKYYSNNHLTRLTFKQTFFWADVNNRNITDLTAFSEAFLQSSHLGKMIAQYVVMNETSKELMVLRPYQFYAVEAIVKRVKSSEENGYIWHTTGSGKTLTSFKASQIVMDIPEVHKVVFVVDRKDLDYQTMTEFNSFKKGSVDVTDNTSTLVKQLSDDTQLVVTTIQKLNNAISKTKYQSRIEKLGDKRIVFIFDECHRSQFGQTHKAITSFFKNCQLFGFTGTPIFADNAQKNEMGKRTTKDLFKECLHKYVITDAIRDQNVLRFNIEYVGRYKQKGSTFIDIPVEDIDTKEVIDSEARLEKITDYIINYHDIKTHKRDYTAMFAVSSIDALVKYYDLFKKKKLEGKHDLKIATIFSYRANEDDEDATGMLPGDLSMAAEPMPVYETSHTREKLDEYISDYNEMYSTSFSTKDSDSFEKYFQDISGRAKGYEEISFNVKDRVDIILVVNMLLTGFDAKKVNTLYVDKNLKHHGLIQAFSRTNRILGEKKSQGNILSFRNLKKATDDAILLFSNKEAKETILLPPCDVIENKFDEAYKDLMAIAPTFESVDDLPSEEEQMAFIQAFRKLMRIRNVLASYVEFTWDELPMDEQTFEDYKGKFLGLYESVKSNAQKEKVSILEEVDFELELLHRDEINVAYILKLLAGLKNAPLTEQAQQKKVIMDMLTGDVELRSKRELIEKFISDYLDNIKDVEDIPEEFEKYWSDQKVLAIGKLCEEENL